ncbi:MAG TPA: hypothetical protein VGI92_03820 [Gemmatimonadales bacterium]
MKMEKLFVWFVGPTVIGGVGQIVGGLVGGIVGSVVGIFVGWWAYRRYFA